MLEELIVSFWIDLKATWLQSDSSLAAAPLTPGTFLDPDSDLDPVLSPMKEGAKGHHITIFGLIAVNLTQNTKMQLKVQADELHVSPKTSIVFFQTLYLRFSLKFCELLELTCLMGKLLLSAALTKTSRFRLRMCIQLFWIRIHFSCRQPGFLHTVIHSIFGGSSLANKKNKNKNIRAIRTFLDYFHFFRQREIFRSKAFIFLQSKALIKKGKCFLITAKRISTAPLKSF